MSVEEPLGIQTYNKAKAISRTLENDDEEYNLIEKINKKMMGRGSDET